MLILSGCMGGSGGNQDPAIDYKQQMRDFVQGISRYAKSENPVFCIIPQNGAELISSTGDETGSADMNYINAIDGIGQESLFYGYQADDIKTPADVLQWTSIFLDMAKTHGITVLVTDYCYSPSNIDDSYAENDKKGYVSFAADHRELDDIPGYPPAIKNENSNIITNLAQVQNFLYLINPGLFSSRQDFVDAITNTNYDLVIIDFFFNGEEFSLQQIMQLKKKKNGGKRLLIAYMSIGEAEDYRYYWEDSWIQYPPDWLKQEDPDWPGNYYVEYWNKDWQQIIYGKADSYLDKILNAGFDGVYLDRIDAFEFFENTE